MTLPVAPEPRQSYHHGNLRQALIDAALALLEEGGVEALSVRSAAQRAGVHLLEADRQNALGST